MESTKGYLAWKLPASTAQFKELYVMLPGATAWQHYASLPPTLKRPDAFLTATEDWKAVSSKGFATMQHLLKLGFIYHPTESMDDDQKPANN